MNSAPPTEPVPSIPAATIVIFRHGPDGGPPELLMVTRSQAMSFAGGAAVFPGGRVDPSDRVLADRLGCNDPDEAAHRIAAIRETLEETGLVVGLSGVIDAVRAVEARALLLESGDLAAVLEAMNWSLDLAALRPFARWHPKNERIPRVFDTRFYLADLGTGAVQITVDKTENTHLFWVSAADALAAAERGELTVIYPTRRNLERLAQFASFAEASADCDRHPVRTITPFLSIEEGTRWLRIPPDAGYPVTGEPLDHAMRGD